MATVREEFELLKAKIHAGKENEIVHVVWHEQERRRKLQNPNRSTRVMLNCRTPEQWKQFQAAKEKYFELAKDPQIGIDLMIRALIAGHAHIASWLNEGQEEPEWMK